TSVNRGRPDSNSQTPERIWPSWKASIVVFGPPGRMASSKMPVRHSALGGHHRRRRGPMALSSAATVINTPNQGRFSPPTASTTIARQGNHRPQSLVGASFLLLVWRRGENVRPRTPAPPAPPATQRIDRTGPRNDQR